ncbi:hypothetical protein L1S35_05370 [Flavobacterium sp. AS60]|uniref:fibrobacter succinogenes major paralogous domain-containing protein n=1 Tax=Flavobacterium anseongense TaxID=2910677 RepID=UPI001F2A808D|nr:FISUMP domain-containing protein [Flavobacterium sp. AS60]MCF6129095.1 hypothetical protein [Flavobacterium sp. AS60]
MKNLFFLLIVILILSCSSNSDNSNSTESIAPSNLTGNTISTTQINLTWINNSNNNAAFDIYRKSPTNSYTIVGNVSSGITTFSDISLMPNTLYTYKVSLSGDNFFTNEISISTSNITYLNGTGVNDLCGNSYPSIIINNKEWMKKNLSTCQYRNGDIIPQVQDQTQWSNLTTGAWCYYLNNSANETVYGKLYNWYAVNDPRGLAPQGWHIPSDIEWQSLSNYLGGDNFAGGKMKGGNLWRTPNNGSLNESGFTALPAGLRFGDGTYTTDTNDTTNFWSSTQNDNISAKYRGLYYGFTNLSFGTYGKKSGWSVRCIKD